MPAMAPIPATILGGTAIDYSGLPRTPMRAWNTTCARCVSRAQRSAEQQHAAAETRAHPRSQTAHTRHEATIQHAHGRVPRVLTTTQTPTRHAADLRATRATTQAFTFCVLPGCPINDHPGLMTTRILLCHPFPNMLSRCRASDPCQACWSRVRRLRRSTMPLLAKHDAGHASRTEDALGTHDS